MTSVMHDLPSVIELVKTGEPLALAGDESLLAQLPEGRWIGGTTPYFMGDDGGLSTRTQIHVTRLGHLTKDARISVYDRLTIERVYADAPTRGFSLIIMPAGTDVHSAFALDAPRFAGFATAPLIGWIAGVHLDDLGKVNAKTFTGLGGASAHDQAVVLHATIPEGKTASVDILNIFEQGNGASITFPENGFVAREATINGKTANLAEYIDSGRIDLRFPLVADYCGAMINVSFQKVDMDRKEVHFYAPIFAGVTYRQATPVNDYVDAFVRRIPQEADRIAFSCNCILNYLFSELEGRQTGGITGPITFGEVAYQLVNQTMAYMTIDRSV